MEEGRPARDPPAARTSPCPTGSRKRQGLPGVPPPGGPRQRAPARQAGRLRRMPYASKPRMPGRELRMKAFGPRWTAPKAGCPLFKPPGGQNHEDDGAGTLGGRPRAKISARKARWPSGRSKNRPGKQTGRAGRLKSGGERKNAAGIMKTGAGKRKKALGSSRLNAGAPTSRFFDKRSPSGGRYGGRPPGVSYPSAPNRIGLHL